ncbi:MAG: AEC family transporter [Synergistales bacterium]|nr:AEC family transporter [Synergistales bacterium]
MNNMILLAVCFLLGIVFRKTGRLPQTTPGVLNAYIINVALPALALLHIHSLKLSSELIYPAVSAWLLFGGGYLFLRCAGKVLGFTPGTAGALILTAGLGNTSFVGLPMIEAFYGREYLGIGILVDQLGSFLVLATLGIAVAVAASSGSASPKETIRKVLLFPPFQAMVLAFALIPLPYPEWLSMVLQRIGETLPPLALLSVGFQLRLGDIRGELAPLSVGLFYKLILGPALVALLYVAVLGAEGTVIQVTLFEAAMAPMITGAIVAADHDLNPALSALMVPTSALLPSRIPGDPVFPGVYFLATTCSA